MQRPSSFPSRGHGAVIQFQTRVPCASSGQLVSLGLPSPSCCCLSAERGWIFPVSSHTNSHLQGCSSPPISSITQSFHIQDLQPLALVTSPLPHFRHIQSHLSTVPISQSPFNVFHILHVWLVPPQPSHLSTHCPQIIPFHYPRPFTPLHGPSYFPTQSSLQSQHYPTQLQLSETIMTTSQPV